MYGFYCPVLWEFYKGGHVEPERCVWKSCCDEAMRNSSVVQKCHSVSGWCLTGLPF